MSPTDFAEILGKIRANTGYLSLHVLGEPLLHPDFAQLLAACHQSGLRVNLVTNGTLVGRQRQTLLTAPALRQISISLHGLAQVEQDAAARYLREILEFAQAASRATSLYISLRLWNLRQSATEEEVAWNDRLLQQLTTAFAVPALSAEELQAQRGIPLAPRVFLNPESQFTWPHPTGPDLGRHGYCRGLRDHLAILADGTVVPCCLDSDGRLALGNILHASLAEILASPRARQLREGFDQQQMVEPLCRRCSYRLRFSPTP